MKKVLLLLAFILPMACSFVSCSSDDENPLTEYNEDWIIGSWDVIEAKGAPYDGRLVFLVYSNQLSIFQDGIEVEEYWYEIENGILRLTEKGDDEVSATCEILSLTETNAKVRLTDLKYGYGSYTVSLKKKKMNLCPLTKWAISYSPVPPTLSIHRPSIQTSLPFVQ